MFNLTSLLLTVSFKFNITVFRITIIDIAVVSADFFNVVLCVATSQKHRYFLLEIYLLRISLKAVEYHY